MWAPRNTGWDIVHFPSPCPALCLAWLILPLCCFTLPHCPQTPLFNAASQAAPNSPTYVSHFPLFKTLDKFHLWMLWVRRQGCDGPSDNGIIYYLGRFFFSWESGFRLDLLEPSPVNSSWGGFVSNLKYPTWDSLHVTMAEGRVVTPGSSSTTVQIKPLLQRKNPQ